MTERFLEFGGDVVSMARRLLGQRLVRVLQGRRLAGTIVEVEAYLGPADRACHTWGGRRTRRNETMWRGGGLAYVYFTYGMHHCLNVVCSEPPGSAVLLRALEPTEGLESMFTRRRRARSPVDLCRGPGRLTAALAIDRAHDGLDLRRSLELSIERVRRRGLPGRLVKATPRIGVGDVGPWARRRLRYYIKDNENVSGPRRLRQVFG